MPVHIGTYDSISLQPRERWTPRTGRVTEPRTKLLNTSVANFTANLRSYGYSYEVEPLGESPYSIVTTLAVSEDATPETILADLWSIDTNNLEKAIWEHPKVLVEMAKTTDLTDRAAIRYNIEQWVRGEETDGATTPANFDPEVYSNLVKSLLAGVEAYTVSFAVLLRAITLPAGTTLAPVFQNANRYYSTASLLAFETTIPANLRAELPAGWWKKEPPKADQQSDGRWVYRVEYWYAENYDGFLYEAAT